MAADDETLRTLLAPTFPGTPRAPEERAHANALFPALDEFDAAAFDDALRGESAIGILTFLEKRVAPLVDMLAEARAARRFGTRHERFARDRVSEILHRLRPPSDLPSNAPRVVLATVSADPAALEIDMAAAVLANAGWRVLSLGSDCPVSEIAAAAGEWHATATVVHVARTSSEIERRLRRLRVRLANATMLAVTGDGTPSAARGFVPVATWAQLDAWARKQA